MLFSRRNWLLVVRHFVDWLLCYTTAFFVCDVAEWLFVLRFYLVLDVEGQQNAHSVSEEKCVSECLMSD